MSQLTSDQPITSLTVGDLKKLLQEVIWEEMSREYYVDEHGLRISYREEEVNPEYLAKLERARREPIISGKQMKEELRALGVEI